MSKPLPQSFYRRDTRQVAKSLLGKVLVHRTVDGLTRGKIVETEAYYGPGDPASHAYKGKTKRAKIMWGKPGIAYVYFTYGMHYLLNVITEGEAKAGAVLIRALEPQEGIDLMKKRRGLSEVRNLTNGPAKLTRAFGITIRQNGIDLTKGDLIIEEGEDEEFEVISAQRIGIKAGREANLRFYIKGNRFVSRFGRSSPFLLHTDQSATHTLFFPEDFASCITSSSLLRVFSPGS